MIETPLSSAKKGPKKVVLQVVRPTGVPPITLLFNPTEYQLQKSNNFAEIAIPGLETPPLQYVRGAGEPTGDLEALCVQIDRDLPQHGLFTVPAYTAKQVKLCRR